MALTVAGCSGGGADDPPRTTAPPSSAPRTNAPRTSAASSTPAPAIAYSAALGSARGPCQVDLPKGWATALDRARLWSGRTSTHVTGVPMPDGDTVLAEDDTRSTSTITLRGTDRRATRTVATIAREHGQGSMGDSAADDRHVAFVYSTVDGQGAQNAWRLYLWDRSTRPARAVAANPTDGSGRPLAGGFVHPLLTGTALFWIQAARNSTGDAIGTAGSALMRYDFASRRTSVVHSGLVTSLLAYRGQILVTAVGKDRAPGASGNPPLTVRAFDATTGREGTPPAGLTAGADEPDWFVTNGDLIVWNTTQGALRGWRPAWGRSRTLVPEFGSWRAAARTDPPMDFPGYPRLLGPLLAWNATATFVLDLRSDSFVQLTTHHGGLEASGTRLAMWQYTKDAPPTYGAGLNTQQWVLDTARLPALPGC